MRTCSITVEFSSSQLVPDLEYTGGGGVTIPAGGDPRAALRAQLIAPVCRDSQFYPLEKFLTNFPIVKCIQFFQTQSLTLFTIFR